MEKVYEIQSFSSAINIALANFAAIAGLGFMVGTFIIGGGFGFLFVFTWIIMASIQSYYIFIANKTYQINLKDKTITIPKSGFEQTDSFSLGVDFYWNLMKKHTINIEDIEDIIVDTKRWESTNDENISKNKLNIIYQLKIVGTFGYSFFKFKSREKRDEISSAICQAIKEVTGKELSCQDDYKPGRADKTLDSFMNNF